MNRIKTFITVSALSLTVLMLPAIASAQYGGYGNGGNYPNGNGGYYPNGNGGYGNNGYYGDMRSTVKNLKNRAKDFQRQLDRDLDNSRYNGSRREDELNDLARDFRNAVGNLDSDDFRNDRYGRNNNNSNDLNRVFNVASQIDRRIGGRYNNMSYNSQNIWNSIRYDLQALGYNGRGNNGGWNNGGWGNGRNRNGNGNGNGGWNRPSWWPF